MVDFLSLLPNELIVKISENVDSKAKRELSLVDRRTHEVVLNAVRDIRVFAHSWGSHSSDIPEDILVRVIHRYPTLERITFGHQNNWFNRETFGTKDAPFLLSLISCLENDPEKHLLSSVKRIEFREVVNNRFHGFNDTKAKELNMRFLSAIGHKDLEKVRVKADCFRNIFTGTEIQPLLTNCSNLKTFVFDGFQSNQTFSLSFESQTQLSKVKLLDWKGSASTIGSLGHCEKLEELVVRYSEKCSDEIMGSLLGEHLWNLKRLELKGVSPKNDAELDALTKKFPNLECLDIDLRRISDDGVELLGRNCPNLRTLQFDRNLTNLGLDRLTRHLPHLETIVFSEAFNITEDGIAAVAQNCKNLRLIRVAHYKKIEKVGIDALIKNCPHLKAVEFSFGGPVSLEGMHYLVEQMPDLRYAGLYNMHGVEEGQIQEFYQKFPQVSHIPYCSSLKKLHHLTI